MGGMDGGESVRGSWTFCGSRFLLHTLHSFFWMVVFMIGV